MEKINCSCGSAKEQVINAEKNVRVGWYCPSCRDFTKAIGREKVWRPHNARSDNVLGDGNFYRMEK